MIGEAPGVATRVRRRFAGDHREVVRSPSPRGFAGHLLYATWVGALALTLVVPGAALLVGYAVGADLVVRRVILAEFRVIVEPVVAAVLLVPVALVVVVLPRERLFDRRIDALRLGHVLRLSARDQWRVARLTSAATLAVVVALPVAGVVGAPAPIRFDNPPFYGIEAGYLLGVWLATTTAVVVVNGLLPLVADTVVARWYPDLLVGGPDEDDPGPLEGPSPFRLF